MKEQLEILKEASVELPKPYLDYLTSSEFSNEFTKGRRNFHLYSLEELCKSVQIDENVCLRVTQLKGYARSLEAIFGDEDADEFSYSELSECLTIGYEYDDILFIDCRDNDSLWIFYPDGGDIEPIKITLKKIVNRK